MDIQTIHDQYSKEALEFFTHPQKLAQVVERAIVHNAKTKGEYLQLVTAMCNESLRSNGVAINIQPEKEYSARIFSNLETMVKKIKNL